VRAYDLPLTHRPLRDGTAVTGRHVPYYLAAEVMAQAWATLLGELGPGLLSSKDMAVVHVVLDFSRELFVGTATFGVDVLRVGCSSITFGLQVAQDGQVAGTGTTVVVQTDPARRCSVPLSLEQRGPLELLLRR
jgi:acyl-CoA thioesterase FadM